LQAIRWISCKANYTLYSNYSKKLEQINPEYFVDYAAALDTLLTTASEGYGQPSVHKLRRSVVDIDLYNRMKKQVLRFLVLMENLGKKKFSHLSET